MRKPTEKAGREHSRGSQQGSVRAGVVGISPSNGNNTRNDEIQSYIAPIINCGLISSETQAHSISPHFKNQLSDLYRTLRAIGAKYIVHIIADSCTKIYLSTVKAQVCAAQKILEFCMNIAKELGIEERYVPLFFSEVTNQNSNGQITDSTKKNIIPVGVQDVFFLV